MSGRPKLVLGASGIWYASLRKSLPVFVKNMSESCVCATKTRRMKSSSLTCAPRTPCPPRFCSRYSVSGTRLT